MLINNKQVLNLELIKIKQTMKENDFHSLAVFKERYYENISIPKESIHKLNSFIFYSQEYSYHLLSTFLLLDTIDNFMNNKLDHLNAIKADKSLYYSLSVSEDNLFNEEDIIGNLNLKKVESMVRDEIHIYLLPFINDEVNYSIKTTLSSTIVILYNNNLDDINQSIYSACGEYYLEKKLRGKIPYWAKNKEDFVNEFNLWCNNDSSKFKNK